MLVLYLKESTKETFIASQSNESPEMISQCDCQTLTKRQTVVDVLAIVSFVVSFFVTMQLLRGDSVHKV